MSCGHLCVCRLTLETTTFLFPVIPDKSPLMVKTSLMPSLGRTSTRSNSLEMENLGRWSSAIHLRNKGHHRSQLGPGHASSRLAVWVSPHHVQSFHLSPMALLPQVPTTTVTHPSSVLICECPHGHGARARACVLFVSPQLAGQRTLCLIG